MNFYLKAIIITIITISMIHYYNMYAISKPIDAKQGNVKFYSNAENHTNIDSNYKICSNIHELTPEGGPTDSASIREERIAHYTTGKAGFVVPHRLITNIISGSLESYEWNDVCRLDSTATGLGQHVCGYVQTRRNGGTASLWAGVHELIDTTVLPSSVTGSNVTEEINSRADNADTTNRRIGLDIVMTPQINLSGVGSDSAEFGTGMRIQGGATNAHSVVKRAYATDMLQADTVLDATGAYARTSPGLNPVIGATTTLTTVTVMTGSKSIALSPALAVSVGQWIWIPGAGPSGGNLATSVVSVSAATIIIEDAASTTLSGVTETVSWATKPPLTAIRIPAGSNIDLSGNGSSILTYDTINGLRYGIASSGTISTTLLEVSADNTTNISGNLNVFSSEKVSGTITTESRYNSPLHTPVSSSEKCSMGDSFDDKRYHYVCVAPNRLRRAILQDF